MAPKKKTFRYWPQSIFAALALILLSTAFYFFLLQSSAGDDVKSSTPHEASLPGITILSYQNKDVALRDLLSSEKNLLIFWATWCAPCVDEMKNMPKLLPQIKAKGYLPIFINYDQPENKLMAEKFAKDFGVESTFDQRGELLYALGISALPISLIVDKSGKIRKTLRGELSLSKL